MKNIFYCLVFFTAITSVAMVGGCAKDKADELKLITDTTCIVPDTVTYTKDIIPILDTYCTDPSFGSCHQSGIEGSGFDYTYYEGIFPEADGGESSNLYNQVFVQKVMPKDITLGPTALTDCDLQILKAWIDAGAPE